MGYAQVAIQIGETYGKMQNKCEGNDDQTSYFEDSSGTRSIFSEKPIHLWSLFGCTHVLFKAGMGFSVSGMSPNKPPLMFQVAVV